VRFLTLIVLFFFNITFAQLTETINSKVIDGRTKQLLIEVHINTDIRATSEYFYIDNASVGGSYL
jgi:hypothetical protein